MAYRWLDTITESSKDNALSVFGLPDVHYVGLILWIG